MERLLESALGYLIEVIQTTAGQLLILLGPGLVLAVIMYFLSEFVRNQMTRLFGWNFYVYFTAIGTVIHETGHALFALLFLHRITDFQPFAPDPATGELGHVRHSASDGLYQRIGDFFIGIGPIILGSIAIYGAARYLMGSELFAAFGNLSIDSSTMASTGGIGNLLGEVYSNAAQFFATLLQPANFATWQFYVFLYLALAIGSHVKLSLSDLSGAWSGFAALVGAVFALNFITLWIRDFATRYIVAISQSFSFFYAIMLFTIVLILVFAGMILVITVVKAMVRR